VRLFLAVGIDDDTRRQLAAAQDVLRSMLRNARVPPRVAWVDPTIAHVTLRFIGESSDDTTALLQSALSALSFPPFEVTWGTVGVFGGSRHPKVIWIGATSGVAALTSLAHEIDVRIDPVIGAPRSQPFSAHLTLCRVRERGKGAEWRHALDAMRLTPTVTRIERVTLYQSRLSSKGPTYTAVSSHG
jgi:RNA 2',3'-cyclic 3'-phosphodiesterase